MAKRHLNTSECLVLVKGLFTDTLYTLYKDTSLLGIPRDIYLYLLYYSQSGSLDSVREGSIRPTLCIVSLILAGNMCICVTKYWLKHCFDTK